MQGADGRPGTPRIAAISDLDGLTQTVTAAFRGDPLWRWAFPDPDQMEPWWRLLIASAFRYPWVWMSGDYAATAIWIPPQGVELTETEEAQVEPLLSNLTGAHAPAIMELLERFDAAHPTDQPHYYLSLLATHPDHRGKGLGMDLLAHCLDQIDGEGMPAYLESSNPANHKRYEGAGFAKIGEFSTPDGKHTVASMWREAR
jgi:GNAT superfamily N-acetyltransferase